VLWTNLMLLFCLSLFPFTTAWVAESSFARTPVVIYGLNLLSAATAYVILQTVIIRQQGPESPLRQAIGTDLKGKVSPVFYLAGTLGALTIDRSGHFGVGIALACFVGAAIVWIAPDRRIDRMVREYEAPG
jgi:uncharacterized membrane protein